MEIPDNMLSKAQLRARNHLRRLRAREADPTAPLSSPLLDEGDSDDDEACPPSLHLAYASAFDFASRLVYEPSERLGAPAAREREPSERGCGLSDSELQLVELYWDCHRLREFSRLAAEVAPEMVQDAESDLAAANLKARQLRAKTPAERKPFVCAELQRRVRAQATFRPGTDEEAARHFWEGLRP